MKPEEKITHAIISANHTEFWLRQIPCKQAEKNLLNRTIKALRPYVVMSEHLDNVEEKPFEEVYNQHIELLNEVSSIKLYESSEVAAVIRAYKKDPKAIISITNKILK